MSAKLRGHYLMVRVGRKLETQSSSHYKHNGMYVSKMKMLRNKYLYCAEMHPHFGDFRGWGRVELGENFFARVNIIKIRSMKKKNF